MNSITVIRADLSNARHQHAVLAMMDAYASDPMGDGRPLTEYARTHLIAGLRAHPTTVIFLAFSDATPVGIVTCFGGFSTFAAKPLLNISDFCVLPKWRGQQIGRAMLQAVEHYAREVGCCRLTLEVQEHNVRAQSIYGQFGFSQSVHVAEAGGALFMSKSLD